LTATKKPLPLPLYRRFTSAIDAPAVTGSLAAFFYFIFLLFNLNLHDPGTFPQAADTYADPALVPPNLHVIPNSTGYDGQFYYRYALEPFTRDKEGFGIDVGSPRYRQQRIMYPLLGWALSFGEPLLAVYSLIWVNFLGLVIMGYLGGLYAQQAARHAFWGLAFALYPGFLYTLSRDLVEIAEAVFLLAGLVLLERNRTAVSSTFLSLAILAKETALLSAVALLSERKKWAVAILPIAVYGGWQLFMNWWWGYLLDSSTGKNIGLPIIGIVRGYQIGYEGERWIITALFLGTFLLLVLSGLRQSTAQRHIKVAWGLYLLLTLTLTRMVWVESLAFLRAASLFYLFGTAVLLKNYSWVSLTAFLGSIGFWVWLAIDWLNR